MRLQILKRFQSLWAKGGFERNQPLVGSIHHTLVSAKRLFLWGDGGIPPAAWMQHVNVFLNNPGNTRYSYQQFCLMLSRNHFVEHQYLEGFKASPSVSNVKRMLVHEFGDSVFTVNNISIEAEFKLVRMRPHSKQNCVSLSINCYRPVKYMPDGVEKNERLDSIRMQIFGWPEPHCCICGQAMSGE